MRIRAAFLLALVAGCGSPKSDAPPLGSSPQSDDASASGNPIPTQDAGQIDDATTFPGFDTGVPWNGEDAGFPVGEDAGHPPTYDAGPPLECVPGIAVACTGPYGCPSFQACNASGTGYEPCNCPDAGTFNYDDGGDTDAYAPLPPPVGNQGYNAIWSQSQSTLFLPLFSAPDCDVVPPYGESYEVNFHPTTTGPVGTFPSCSVNPAPSICYLASRSSGGDDDTPPNGVYTLSSFNGDGIASGQMNTLEGIVPLVVKYCQ